MPSTQKTNYFYSIFIILLFAAILPTSAAKYPAPNISKIMFHLDRIPLDQVRLIELSNDLVTLALKDPKGDQQNLNTSARLLAIALRIQPQNKGVEIFNQKFIKRQPIRDADSLERIKALKRTQHILKYLLNSKKLSEENTLANYLKDALHGIDPNMPILQKHKVFEPRWKNVINTEIPKKDKLKPTKPLEKKIPGTQPRQIASKPKDINSKIDEDIPSLVQWHQLSAIIQEPLTASKKDSKNESYFLSLVPQKITISPIEDQKNSLNVVRRFDEETTDINKMIKPLINILKKKYNSFPSANIEIQTPINISKYNKIFGLYPLAIQTIASLEKQKIKSGVNIIGRLDLNGEVKQNFRFWNRLKLLRTSQDSNQTLIAPLGSESHFLQLIAMEEADFFVRYEVVLVNEIDQAVAYASELKDPDLLEAHQKFASIQNEIGKQSVGAFSVKEEIRTKLQEIIKLNPHHLSAKMILIRGDSKRSNTINPTYLAEEFKPVFKRLKIFYDKDLKNLYLNQNYPSSTIISDSLDRISRYVDRDYEDILEALGNIATELDNLERARKRNSSSGRDSFEKAHERFKENYDIVEQFIQEQKLVDQ